MEGRGGAAGAGERRAGVDRVFIVITGCMFAGKGPGEDRCRYG